jgi:hypothetical protein
VVRQKVDKITINNKNKFSTIMPQQKHSQDFGKKEKVLNNAAKLINYPVPTKLVQLWH